MPFTTLQTETIILLFCLKSVFPLHPMCLHQMMVMFEFRFKIKIQVMLNLMFSSAIKDVN